MRDVTRLCRAKIREVKAQLELRLATAVVASRARAVTAPVLGTGEAAPRTLGSVSGPSLQEGRRGAGACPGKGSGAGEGAGAQVL